ncbi:hypothetical protein HPP92_002654 [Vanilla planifolia]|uniref:Uncharacterized protein n=1 Tax=Vanilla planifolia TaxID=51239 RepID=A0A835VKS7_VANPL|nr:hypothetical protein HPP92_002654 [Vanilla planifolia]
MLLRALDRRPALLRPRLAGWVSRCVPAARPCLRPPKGPLPIGRRRGRRGAAARAGRLPAVVTDGGNGERGTGGGGMDFFAAGIASVSAQQREAAEGRPWAVMRSRRKKELGMRGVVRGLAVAVGSLAEVSVAGRRGVRYSGEEMSRCRRRGGSGRSVI